MILFNDFKKQSEDLVKAELSAIERVLRSGWWVLGNEVESFEREWSEWLGVEHSVGVANGMDAIEIGLRVLGIGKGDEVITTPMTAFATVLAIMRAGAEPIFADIDLDTAMITKESIKRCVTSKTKAVVFVHLYGQAGPVDEIKLLCDQYNMFLVEDCAQAHGAKLNGKSVGSYGHVAAWSFYPTKNLGAIGDAGALSTGSIEFKEKANVLRNYGQTKRYYHPVEGLNSRLDELQAAILRERLHYLDQWIIRRREIVNAYSRGIVNKAIRLLPFVENSERHVHHLFVVITDNRLALQSHLKEKGIESLIHYPVPIHLQEPCKNLRADPNGLSNSEFHASHCLSLPCHPEMTNEEVEKVIMVINEFKL